MLRQVRIPAYRSSLCSFVFVSVSTSLKAFPLFVSSLGVAARDCISKSLWFFFLLPSSHLFVFFSLLTSDFYSPLCLSEPLLFHHPLLPAMF